MRESREAHDHVHLLKALAHDLHARGHLRKRVGTLEGCPPEAAERGREAIDDTRMLDIAGDGHDDLGRHVLVSEVGGHCRPREPVHAVTSSQDGPSQGMPLPDLLGKDIVDNVVRRVLHHLDLLQDHRLLALQLLGVEEGVQEDIGEQIHSQWQVLVENLHVEAGMFLGRKGVHLATDRIHGARDVFRAPGGRPLEHQVLDQVRDPAPIVRFTSGACAHPDSHRDRANVRHTLGEDADPVGKDALAILFSHGPRSPLRS